MWGWAWVLKTGHLKGFREDLREEVIPRRHLCQRRGWNCGCSSVVEYICNKCEALGSNRSIQMSRREITEKLSKSVSICFHCTFSCQRNCLPINSTFLKKKNFIDFNCTSFIYFVLATQLVCTPL